MDLKDLLDPRFIYGALAGASLVLLFLMRLVSFNFTFQDNQVHAYTLLWILALFAFAYSIDPSHRKEDAKRFLTSLAVTIFVFYIHDSLWTFGAIFNGVRLEGIATIWPDPIFYVDNFSRNSIIIALSWIPIRKSLHYRRLALLLGLDLAFWIFSVFAYDLYYFPLYALFDSLPALALINPLQNGFRGKG